MTLITYITRTLLLCGSLFVVGCSANSELSQVKNPEINVGGPAATGSSSGLHGAIDAMKPGILLDNRFTLLLTGDNQKYTFEIDLKAKRVDGSVKNINTLNESSFKGFASLEELQENFIDGNSTTVSQMIPVGFWDDFESSAANLSYVEGSGEKCEAGFLKYANIYIDNKQFPSLINIPGKDQCYVLDLRELSAVLAQHLQDSITSMQEDVICTKDVVLSEYVATSHNNIKMTLSSGSSCIPTWPLAFGFEQIK